MDSETKDKLALAFAALARAMSTEAFRNRRLRRPDRRAADRAAVGAVGAFALLLFGGGRYASAFASGAGRTVWGEARKSLASQD